MALKPQDAVVAARNIWAGPRIMEAGRLNYIAAAVTPRRAYSGDLSQPWAALGDGRPTVEMPPDAPQVMKNLAFKSRTNFLPLVLDAFSQLMKVDGYVAANGKPNVAWDKYWQPNGLDARQTGIIRSALQNGASYASILPGDTVPVIKGYSARRMTAIYADPDIDDWPLMALDVNGPMLRLFDEEGVYRIGLENFPLSGLGARSVFTPASADFRFIDFSPHGFDFCPVVRFRDRMLLDGEEVFGVVEPLIDIQKRVDETVFEMAIAQYYQAFRQRYVIGWVPQSEKEWLETSSAAFWAFKDADVKVGTLEPTDVAPYIASKQAGLTDMAAIAQLPASALGANSANMRNVSPEAVASSDAGQDRKGSEVRTSLGESFELMLRTAALLDGDDAAATDTSSQVRWRDMTTTSPGAIVDALGKLKQMLGVPAEILWERIPGWTDQDQARALQILQSGDSIDRLIATLEKQQPGQPQPPSDPAIAAGLGGQ